jgi:two-component system chemotaxis sensor kinase CheA
MDVPGIPPLKISSKKGQGTTITLKLPVTLAIIDGFLTRTGGEHFIFPLSQVEECIEMVAPSGTSQDGRRLANVRGNIVPYVHLREYFGIKEASPGCEQIVITKVDNRRVGFVVDTVLGQHKTVLKSLGRFYKDVEVISGVTIMGDGTVAMILNIPNLVSLVEQQEALGNGS